MTITRTNSPASAGAPTRHLKWTGATLLFLTLQGCASTELRQPVRVEVVDVDCPRLEVDPSLLVVAALTPIGRIETNGDLEDAFEVAVADGMRDRGQLTELTAATEQKQRDQKVLDAQCEANKAAQKQAIEDAVRGATATVKRPLLSRLGF